MRVVLTRDAARLGRSLNSVVASQATTPAARPIGPAAAMANPPTAPATNSEDGEVMASASRFGPTVAMTLPAALPSLLTSSMVTARKLAPAEQPATSNRPSVQKFEMTFVNTFSMLVGSLAS